MASLQADSLDTILSCFLHDKSQRANVSPRFTHRLNICKAWSIPQASRLLDVGCGQGDSSLVLAETVGPTGSVTGVDNAPPDYGGPFTVGQAQEHILASPLGPRIAFQRCDTTKWLQARHKALPGSSPPASSCSDHGSASFSSDEHEAGQHPFIEFDGAVLCHSMWYFPSTDAVRELFEALATAGVPRIYVAEWSGRARSAAQEPHALAAQAEQKLYSLRPADYVPRLDEQNIRGGALPPDDLVALAQQVGWSVASRGMVPTPLAIRDGYWEVQHVLKGRFSADVETTVQDQMVKRELLEFRDKIASAMKTLESSGGSLESMDTAWMVLGRE